MTLVIHNAAELVCVARRGERTLRHRALRDVAVIPDGAVIVDGERITWVGPTAELTTIPPRVPRGSPSI